MDKLAQQLSFILELDRLKAVQRQTRVKPDNGRQENSAEHSWHIALVAQVLQEYAEEPININRIIGMLLIHDIVEIDAGDMFAYAEQGSHKEQEQKELAAIDRIFGLLPEMQYHFYKNLWLEFEQAESADARFAKAMDRILPVMQNMADNGGTWARHGVTRSQALKRNEYLKVSAPKLWNYVVSQIDLCVANGWLKDE
ncbi:HD domain-containing protein [Parendozoicomonas haliclonae]|uniref:5'-nucleotidase n=1 Tax=Parendozoicomonas haliclonae TaxID=1960125 RepID=A0A1X7AK57_9GAMM|nr:HD domain-containing protein [Parendozoicomonas haliclonae]SMA43064.1 5'-nucleotidase [Parendozoicomonas haliclonae]